MSTFAGLGIEKSEDETGTDESSNSGVTWTEQTTVGSRYWSSLT